MYYLDKERSPRNINCKKQLLVKTGHIKVETHTYRQTHTHPSYNKTVFLYVPCYAHNDTEKPLERHDPQWQQKYRVKR